MSHTFLQIFSLPVELVCANLFDKMLLRDLAGLDKAINNRAMRQQFLRAIRGARVRHFQLTLTANAAQLDWLALRGMKVEHLSAFKNTEETSLSRSGGFKLHVTNIVLLLSEHFLDKAALQWLSGIDGCKSVSLYTLCGLTDAARWNEALKLHANLDDLQIITHGRDEVHDARILQFVVDLTKHFRFLTNLRIDNLQRADLSCLTELTQRCPELRELSLDGCTRLTDEILQSLSENCTKLQSLNLSARTGAVSDAGLLPLLQRCHTLSSVKLWDCSGVTAHTIVLLAAVIAQASSLQLTNCRALNSILVVEAINSFHHLSDLDLRNTNIAEDLLISLVQNNRELFRIDLSDVLAVTDSVIATIGSACVGLCLLSINRCLQVTDLTPLTKCYMMELQIVGCTGVADATLLKLADSPGHHQMRVYAYGSGVTAASIAILKGSKRMEVYSHITV